MHFNETKAFIEYLNNLFYKYIEEYNPNKNRKIFMVFDDLIADMPGNK